MNKKKNRDGGLVYSTNPNFTPDEPEESSESLPASQMKVRIFLDRLGGGKMVSRIEGILWKDEELVTLAKELKNKCGTGGSCKDGQILIQGDKRDRLVEILQSKGFQVKKAGG